MAKYNNDIPIGHQAAKLRSLYPQSNITWVSHGSEFVWTYSLQPTYMSDIYDVKIKYRQNDYPKVYITNPMPLRLAQNAKFLPHVYDNKKQRLCLYMYREWDNSKFIADYIVPWTAEWLFHYECWVITGIWNGGGHGTPKNN